MCVYLGMHDVARVEVSADGCRRQGSDGTTHWWQTLAMYDSQGTQIGEVVLHLSSAAAALPVGSQPPYWGVDASQHLAIVDGESPF